MSMKKIQNYCVGLTGVVNAIHKVSRALSGTTDGVTISEAVEEVATAIENGGGGGGGGTTDHTRLTNRDSADQHPMSAITGLGTALTSKQDVLISGSNIKTINGNSILGSGNLPISGGGGVDVYEIAYGETDETKLQGAVHAINEGKLIKLTNLQDLDAMFDFDSYVIPAVGGGSTSNQYPMWFTYEDYLFNIFIDDNYGTRWGSVTKNYLVRDSAMDSTSTNGVQNKVIKAYVDNKVPSIQTQGDWMYKVYADGTFDAWYKATKQSLTITATSGNLYRSELQTLTLPTNLTNGKTVTIQTAVPGASHNNYPVWAILANVQDTEVRYYALSGGSRTASPNYIVTAHVFGTIQ